MKNKPKLLFYFASSQLTTLSGWDIIYSITQTAIENSLKSQEYLEYIFKQRQQNNLELEDLLPWSPKIPDSCKMNRD